MRYILLTILVLLIPYHLVAQWAPKKGEGGAIFSLRYSSSDAFYNADGDLVGSLNDATFQKYELGVYYSYGLGKRFGVFGGLSFAALRYNDKYIDNKSAGFGNPMIGVVYQITDFPSPIIGATLSTTLPLRFPTDAQPVLGGARYKANVYTEFIPRIFTANGIDIVKDKFVTFFGAEFAQSTNTNTRALKFGITFLFKINKSYGLGIFGEFVTLGRNISAGPAGGLSFWYSLWK